LSVLRKALVSFAGMMAKTEVSPIESAAESFDRFPELFPHMTVEGQLEMAEWADQQGVLFQLIDGSFGCFPTHGAGEGQCSGAFFGFHVASEWRGPEFVSS
jgi:hypothetical protein